MAVSFEGDRGNHGSPVRRELLSARQTVKPQACHEPQGSLIRLGHLGVDALQAKIIERVPEQQFTCCSAYPPPPLPAVADRDAELRRGVGHVGEIDVTDQVPICFDAQSQQRGPATVYGRTQWRRLIGADATRLQDSLTNPVSLYRVVSPKQV